jgi:hypothetical protein
VADHRSAMDLGLLVVQRGLSPDRSIRKSESMLVEYVTAAGDEYCPVEITRRGTCLHDVIDRGGQGRQRPFLCEREQWRNEHSKKP